MITLSKRLEAIASLITPGHIVADVGTDHGYIPIYQIQQNRSPFAIAMDLREGPLQRAAEHIRRCGLSDRIETRLSDGTAALRAGEADTIVVAGMGGELMLRILTDGREVCRGAKELILQPQSEIAEVRRYLRTHAYRIAAEDMVFEDGKYYPMMRVVPETAGQAGTDTQADEKPAEDGKRSGSGACADAACAGELYDLYGEHLLNTHHPVLQQYLVYQEQLLLTILEELKRQPESDKITARMDEIGHKLKYNRMAQNQTT